MIIIRTITIIAHIRPKIIAIAAIAPLDRPPGNTFQSLTIKIVINI